MTQVVLANQQNDEEMTLNMGPHHPSTHGVLRFIIQTDGEIIRRAVPDVGYLHRSIEKIGERCTYPGFMPYTDRVDYVAAMFANECWAMACEKLMDIEVPKRAQYLRVLSGELNRISSHLVAAGAMAMDIGACPYGNWSGRHTTSWERHAPEFGDLSLDHACHRHCYPLSLMINAEGKRFVDEGIEFYNYTYAKYGAEVFKQTEQFAYQVFDAKAKPLLRPEYNDKQVTKVTANTLEELAGKLEGVNAAQFLKTIKEYNASIKTEVPFNHAVKDGRCTVGIEPQKSNWAIVLDTAPFEAYHVTCGITFTFGGLRINHENGQVLDVNMHPIPGLYAAGEMVGGIFYFNYAAGTGLVSGSVFGRIAGDGAGDAVKAA